MRKIGKVTNKESEPSPTGQKQPLSPDIRVLESLDIETTIHETKNKTGAALHFTHISTLRIDLVPTDQQSTKTTNRPKPKINSNTIVNRSTSSNNTNDAPNMGFSSHQIETLQQISTLLQGRAATTHPTYLRGTVAHSYGDAATTQPQSGTAATFLQSGMTESHNNGHPMHRGPSGSAASYHPGSFPITHLHSGVSMTHLDDGTAAAAAAATHLLNRSTANHPVNNTENFASENYINTSITSDPIMRLADVLNSALQTFSDASINDMSINNTRLVNRLTTARDLPTFSGNPLEWLHFIKTYESTSALGEYDDQQNFSRLFKALKGDARESVSTLLATSNDAASIIKNLKVHYGNERTIAAKIVKDLQDLPSLVIFWQNYIIAVRVNN